MVDHGRRYAPTVYLLVLLLTSNSRNLKIVTSLFYFFERNILRPNLASQDQQIRFQHNFPLYNKTPRIHKIRHFRNVLRHNSMKNNLYDNLNSSITILIRFPSRQVVLCVPNVDFKGNYLTIQITYIEKMTKIAKNRDFVTS